MTFDAAYERLQSAFRANRLAQGYIVGAPPQSIGRDFALRVIQMLFCSSGTGCGACAGCISVAERRQPDVMWLEPQKKSRILSIDDVRVLQNRIMQTARSGGWKCVVLVGADRLGPQASNAFLKTLEEPTPKTIFLLLAENPQFLLTTIRSRCQMIAIDGSSRIPAALEDEIVRILTNVDVRASFKAGGRYAAGFSQSEAFVAMLTTIKDAIEKQEMSLVDDREDVDNDVILARASARYRETRTSILQAIEMWYRDIMVLACKGDPRSLHYPDHLQELQSLAASVSVASAVRCVRTVEEMNEQLERNIPDGVVFDGAMPMLQIA